MSSHSECGYTSCPHCVGDGWTTFARKLLGLRTDLRKRGYAVVWPDEMQELIVKNAADETLEEESG
ncbi:hypothetical protein LCGC14_2803240 [marine sediment metagenome]|uniref:Uncharacterized protein n=1 Tax=marine sediment metagenome TaxID=412755 RepID=A0A0F9AVH2_9ZZZZ